MQNVILRLIGSIGLALSLGSAIGASSLEASCMGAFLYLLFATIDNN